VKYIDPETVETPAYEYHQTIDSWRDLPEDLLKRLGVPDTSKVKQHLEAKAMGDVSEERVESLNSIAADKLPDPIKHLLTIVIGAFGAITIGSSIANMGDSNGRNPLVIGIGSLTGGMVAICTDKYLEGYFTKRKMRKFAESAIDRVAKES
jgi:hypothetical protein